MIGSISGRLLSEGPSSAAPSWPLDVYNYQNIFLRFLTWCKIRKAKAFVDRQEPFFLWLATRFGFTSGQINGLSTSNNWLSNNKYIILHKICPQSQSEIFPASTGGAEQMCSDMSLQLLGRLPLDPQLARCCDRGDNFLETLPNSPAVLALHQILDSKLFTLF